VLGAQLALNALVALVGLGLLMGVSLGPFHFQAHADVLAFLVTVVLSILGPFAMGILVAAVSPTGPAAYVIGAIVFRVLMFVAGLWIPRAEMSPTLVNVGNYTRLGAAVQAFQGALGGTFPALWALSVLAGSAVVFGILAVRLFRWQ
jgi:ABC-2 type transport system permease protein